MDPWAGVSPAAVLLFFVMDSCGNVPLVLTLLKDVEKERRRRVVQRQLAIDLVVLLFFLLFGQTILGFLGLPEESVAFAGGIALGVIGMRLLFPSADGVMGYQAG